MILTTLVDWCCLNSEYHVNNHGPWHNYSYYVSCSKLSNRFKTRMWVWKGCGIVLGILFFFGCFFFLVGGGFGAVQAPFWENPGVKGRFVRVFRTFGGRFRAVQAPFWGNQWWNAGSIQVWTQKTASKSKLSRSFLFSVCIYLCWCVCVFVIEYVVCVFFLLLFWFFIQCTSFLVFAIYLFNV